MQNSSSNGNILGSLRQNCSVLAVVCDSKVRGRQTEDRLRYPFPGLGSSSRLEVYTEFLLIVLLNFLCSCFCFLFVEFFWKTKLFAG